MFIINVLKSNNNLFMMLLLMFNIKAQPDFVSIDTNDR